MKSIAAVVPAAVLMAAASPVLADTSSIRDLSWGSYIPSGANGFAVYQAGPDPTLNSGMANWSGARGVWSWSPYYSIFPAFVKDYVQFNCSSQDCHILMVQNCAPGTGCNYYNISAGGALAHYKPGTADQAFFWPSPNSGYIRCHWYYYNQNDTRVETWVDFANTMAGSGFTELAGMEFQSGGCVNGNYSNVLQNALYHTGTQFSSWYSFPSGSFYSNGSQGTSPTWAGSGDLSSNGNFTISTTCP